MVLLNKLSDAVVQGAAEDVCRAREAGERINIAATAREYGVDRNRLIRRLKSVGS